ncbi:MAG: FAD-dependent oxidoreductase [Anaerolineales bacterium]|nr:FAD-dependent oxidoreductase [Anaerolineales bacterium]
MMATCAVEGQAAGTAAALCLSQGIAPRELYRNKPLLKQYQQTLLRDDQTIRGVVNDDPADLARQARVAAPAAKVIDGHVRGDAHLWVAKMEGEPWIELSWPAPRKISEVQLTFDTAFGRMLTLSAQASVNRELIRGAQPETVRDYTVSVRRPGGGWSEIVSVTGNFLRLRRHRFTLVEAEAVRVTVKATNGGDTARIFEVRCYG